MVVFPAPDGPTSATVSPGAIESETSCRIQSLGSSAPGVSGASSDGSETSRPGGMTERHVVELDASLHEREIDRVGAVGDGGREVEDFEDALERDERGHHVDARIRELRERLVDLPDIDRERRDRACGDRAGNREIAADPVHDGRSDGGDQTEGDEQHPAVHRGLDADVANAGGASGRNQSCSRERRPNSFETSAPATLNRSAVRLFICAFICMPSRVSCCSFGPMRRAG